MKILKTVEEKIETKYRKETRFARLNKPEIRSFAEYAYTCNSSNEEEKSMKSFYYNRLIRLLMIGFTCQEVDYFWKIYSELIGEDERHIVDELLGLIVKGELEPEGFSMENVLDDYIKDQKSKSYVCCCLREGLIGRLSYSVFHTIKKGGCVNLSFDKEVLRRCFISTFGLSWLEYLISRNERINEIVDLVVLGFRKKVI